MGNKMEKNLENLNQIFNKKIFRIPDFQRGYSWGKEQLDDFWGDIELLSENEVHYTGLLTYEKIKKLKDADDIKLKEKYSYDAYYIIDGQQRLTTISILLKAILKFFDENDLIIDESKKDWEKKFLYKEIEGYEYFIFGYESDNPSDYFFKNDILERPVSNKESDKRTIYTNNLFKAKIFFDDKLSSLNKDEKISIFRKVVTQLKFNKYEVDSELEVFIIFETMNNRGKNLSKLELLKNRLIYLSTKINDVDLSKEKLRTEINDSWKVIYNYLGKNLDNVLNDDDFLKDHWIMYFSGYKRNEANVFSKFLLNKHFTARNIIQGTLTGQEIKNYVNDLQISIENYFFINNPTYNLEGKKDYSQSIVYLEKLNRVGYSSFTPLIISLLNKKISDDELVEILKSIERFIFVIFKISKFFSTFNNSKFYTLANQFKHGKISSKDINENIDDVTKTYVNVNSFKEWILPKFKTGKGYYDWYSSLRYFLFEYELFLKNKKGINENKLIWNNFAESKKDYLTIEHIFPQSKIKNDLDKITCHTLGNLVPLSREINSKLQDSDFGIKKQRYKDGSLSEREIFDNYNEWNQEAIKKRGLVLLDFMSKRWSIDLKDEEFKLELLGFVGEEKK
jgi:uncharacterized protein with ParB-like and HNH nuclease domain